MVRSHDPSELGRRVEAVVRHDLGATDPLPYRVIAGDTRAPDVGGIARDTVGLMVGARLGLVAEVEFDLPWPRPATLTVSMTRVGVQCVGSAVRYSIVLGGALSAELSFDPPRRFTAGRFYQAGEFLGHPAAERLNAVPGLVKDLGRIVRDKEMVGTIMLSLESGVVLAPIDASSCHLVVVTLPRSTGFLGSSATTDAGLVLGLAARIEDAL